ncbi:hypothetical protein SAMN04487910_1912 [Aquimarina amphilecti]|uniref:Uncharacterized protein n=2 Tax=Aquimarina amphilecti TaxID=1038014 RepID=A0A1H7MZG9_AQUAM|nr:hypothetical protein SAMN04487910_1912 [Aquimarina amphilecti]
MKMNHNILKGILCVLFASFILSCNKEEIESSALQFNTSKEAEEVTSMFSMDARIASLYALQYAKAIDPDFRFVPGTPKTPKFITGKGVASFIDLNELPIEREEISFIKEILYKEDSRAILIQEVYDRKNQAKVNVLYIPYPTEVNVPKDYVFQDGVLIDDFQAAYLPPYLWASIGLDGAGSYCSCTITLRNFNTLCSACPDLSTNFLTVFEDYFEGDDIDNYDEVLNNSIAIDKVPIGGSIFNL